MLYNENSANFNIFYEKIVNLSGRHEVTSPQNENIAERIKPNHGHVNKQS